MSQKKRGNKDSKWLRLAVGAALLAGASGAVMPGMAGAAEVTVNSLSDGDNNFWGSTVKPEEAIVAHDGWSEEWFVTTGGEPSGNVLSFDGFVPADYDLRIAAGYGKDVAVTGNKLNVTNSTLRGVLAGGLNSGNGEISGNVVTLGAGTKVADGASLQVFGGFRQADEDNIANNTVNILTAIELDALKGGENKSYSAGANGNTLNIAAKNVKTNWFGSFENVNFFLPSDIANGDTMLTVTNGGSATDLSGIKVGVAAQSGVSLTKGDTVNLLLNNNGITNPAAELTAIENKYVEMIAPNSLLSDKEYTFGLGATDTALTATVTDVKELTGEQPTEQQTEQPAEQPTDQPAEAVDNNDVTISDGEVKSDVYGGKAVSSASGNKVTMNGGQVDNNVYGGYTTGADAKADNNTVTVNEGTVGNSIYGGYSEQGSVSGNTVNVNGKAALTGGWAKVIGGFSAMKDAAVTDNTVNLIDVDGMSLGNLQGGAVEYVDASGATQYDGAGNVSNNTVNFVASKNISTHYFSGFSTANFYLSKDIANGDTVLTVSDGDVNLDGMNVGVAAPYGLDKLQEKDSVNLIKTSENKLSGTPTKSEAPTDTTKVSFLTPANLMTDKKYDFSLSTTSDALVATLDSIGGTEANNVSGDRSNDAEVVKNSQRVKSLVETQAAAVTVLNSGTDLLTGSGFTQAKVAAGAAEGGKFAPFAAMGGSNLRAESGSHVDTKGYGIDVGFAREIKKGSKTYLLAPVVEYGRGNYDSYQDNGIKASGKSSFWGIGMMARQTNDKGVYYEGSFRAGRISSDYSGQLSAVTYADYDSDSNYWAGHLGWGRVSQLAGNNSLDTYVKYFYNHQDGETVDVKINGGALTDQIAFDAVESQRLRLGVRFTHAVNDSNSLYAGLAYQLETKGEARATYRGNETAAPSVKGSSGMLELGWQVKPGKNPVSLDLGVTGWAGKQRGVSGKLGFKYNF